MRDCDAFIRGSGANRPRIAANSFAASQDGNGMIKGKAPETLTSGTDFENADELASVDADKFLSRNCAHSTHEMVQNRYPRCLSRISRGFEI